MATTFRRVIKGGRAMLEMNLTTVMVEVALAEVELTLSEVVQTLVEQGAATERTQDVLSSQSFKIRAHHTIENKPTLNI